ncbi:MAG: aspartate aminotransferase [bacterium]|jgi:aspartate aminotransferase
MTISNQIKSSIENSSWIRKMFEEGGRLVELHGKENVFDLSLGNPIFEPPQKVKDSLIGLLESDETGSHRYMSNAGFEETRAYVAQKLAEETKLEFQASDIVMCVGAGGGLNVLFKTLCNAGDEVLTFSPYFVEYRAYTSNHGAVLKAIDTTDIFQINFSILEEAITEKTRIVLINSPNNPTGVVYPESELEKLGKLLTKKSEEFGTTITLVSDEPYKKIVYDDYVVPSVFQFYDESIVVTSHSKDLALPGERIGYIAVSPKTKSKDLVLQGLIIALRILGFVNAPALMQRVLPLVDGEMVDLSVYQKNRDILYNHLIKCGFECVKPEGAFYLFPKSPVGDDLEFIREAQKHNLLLTPGTGFGKKGYFRIAYCFETSLIERVLPIFSALAKQYELS